MCLVFFRFLGCKPNLTGSLYLSWCFEIIDEIAITRRSKLRLAQQHQKTALDSRKRRAQRRPPIERKDLNTHASPWRDLLTFLVGHNGARARARSNILINPGRTRSSLITTTSNIIVRRANCLRKINDKRYAGKQTGGVCVVGGTCDSKYNY